MMATNTEDPKRLKRNIKAIPGGEDVGSKNVEDKNESRSLSFKDSITSRDKKRSLQEVTDEKDIKEDSISCGSRTVSRLADMRKGESVSHNKAESSSSKEAFDSAKGAESSSTNDGSQLSKEEKMEMPKERKTVKVQVKSTSEEEIALHGIMEHIHSFSFDKAKEQAEKERDASRASGSPMWQMLLGCMVQFVLAEKLYMNMSFLVTKGFLRKEISVRAAYESLITELEELCMAKRVYMKDLDSSSDDGSADQIYSGLHDLLRHLCGQLLVFTRVRLQMIAFYEKMTTMAMGRLMNYEELLSVLSDISTQHARSFHHPLLSAVKTNFTYECDIQIHLLRSQVDMQTWRFLPSLISLHDANSKLNNWHSFVQSKETKKYGFGSSFLKSSPLPILYQWLWQAKAAFVSKFSLYFHETLATQSSVADMKTFTSRQACDYVSKIQSFVRKSDASSVCLVFEATGVEDYQGAGYHHPEEHVQPPKGLESYPAIFSYPPTRPRDKWPSIVMRVSDRSNEQELLDRVIHFFDQQIGATYFLCRVEPRITVVVIFDSQKSEKDSYIKDFVFDLTMQLRCNKVFANLKPK